MPYSTLEKRHAAYKRKRQALIADPVKHAEAKAKNNENQRRRKAADPEKYRAKGGVCPACGYCPTCGRHAAPPTFYTYQFGFPNTAGYPPNIMGGAVGSCSLGSAQSSLQNVQVWQ
jgi:hypothetical protein